MPFMKTNDSQQHLVYKQTRNKHLNQIVITDINLKKQHPISLLLSITMNIYIHLIQYNQVPVLNMNATTL